MKSFVKKSNKLILSVGDNFADLISFKNNIAEYEFKYFINVIDAIQRGCTSVKLVIKPEISKNESSLFLSKKPSDIINKILKKDSNAKEIRSFNQDSSIINTSIDPTSKINNELLTTVGDTVNVSKLTKKISLTTKTISEINRDNDNKPVLQISSLALTKSSKNIAELNVNLIFNDKKDPSDLLNHKNTILSKKSSAGLGEKFTSESPALSYLINFDRVASSKEIKNEIMLPVSVQEDDSVVEVKKIVKFDQTKLKNIDSFFVDFELRNSLGSVIEKISKKIDHSRNLYLVQTPVKSPVVKNSRASSNGQNTFEITAQTATKVKVYKKSLKPTLPLMDISYEYLTEIDLKKTSLFVDKSSNDCDTLYRFISVGAQNQISSEYTNIIVPGLKLNTEKSSKFTSAGVIATINPEGGIRVEVVAIPPGVAAVKILRKDKTIYQQDFTVVPHGTTNQSIFLVQNINRTGFFLDKNVKLNHVYEYSCVLIYTDGTERTASSYEYIEYIPLNTSDNVVSINVSKPKVINRDSSTDVVFKINSSVANNSLDLVKKILEKQGLSSLYEDEFLNEKTSLKKLVAFGVRRIDLSTGDSLYFPVFAGSDFSDLDNQSFSDPLPLKPGHSYKYIVYPLLRTAETMFEDNQKVWSSKVASYSYLPLKFFHPVVSTYGNIVDSSALKFNYSKSSFEFGIVGQYVETEISLDFTLPNISNAKAIKFSDKKNIIRWQVIGDKNLIDHFIVIVNRFGQEEILGKSHALFDSDIIEYIHVFDNELGTLKYKIVPVLKNYEYGSAIMTNDISV